MALLLCFAVVFCVGVGVAYYNTRSFGFADGVKIISADKEKFSILDFDIYYQDIDAALEKARKNLPQRHYAVGITTL